MSNQSSDNNKRIAKNTLLLYFRMLFMMVVSLYTSRVVLNALGVEDYGIYNVVGGVVAMFGFINGSMSSATQRYITFALGKGDKKRLQTVFSTTLQIHAMIAGIIVLLGETVGLWFLYNKMQIPADRMDAAFWVLQCSIISTVVMIVSVPYNADIIAHEKMSAFAYISILEVVLKLVIVYMLMVFSFDKLVLYAFLILAIQVLIRFCYSIYCNRHFEETKYIHVWDKGLFKEMTGFAGWNIWGNLAGVLSTTGVNLLLNVFFGPVVNAARGVAVQVQGAIQSFAMNFQMALNPQITKNYAKGNLAEMYKLIERSSRFSFFLLYILSTPVMLLTSGILTLWLKIVPEHTVVFLRIILMVIIIDSMANPIMIAAAATGRVRRYQSIVGGVILLIVPVAYVTLKLGATPEMVFVIHLAVCILAFITRLFIVRPMIQLHIKAYMGDLVKSILPVIVVSFPISYAICKFIAPNNFLLLVVDAVLCVLVCAFSVFFLGLEKHERNVIVEKLLEKFKNR